VPKKETKTVPKLKYQTKNQYSQLSYVVVAVPPAAGAIKEETKNPLKRGCWREKNEKGT